MADTNIYFGTPGALVILPHPRGGVKKTRTVPTQQFALGSGEQRTRRTAYGSRTYELGYERLQASTFATIQKYAQGHMGAGPFAFLDPGERNWLTVDQTSSTAHLNSTTGFSVAGSGMSLSSSTTLVHTNTPRSLALTYANSTPGTSGTAFIDLDPAYPGWPGVPVVLSKSYSFGCYVRGGGTDAIVTTTPQIIWYDATQAVLSVSSGTSVASAAGAWAAMTVTATAPATAAYARPRLAYASGASAGSILYYASFQFNEGSAVDTEWRAGTGVLPVTVAALDEAWPWLWAGEIVEGPRLVLVEDGR